MNGTPFLRSGMWHHQALVLGVMISICCGYRSSEARTGNVIRGAYAGGPPSGARSVSAPAPPGVLSPVIDGPSADINFPGLGRVKVQPLHIANGNLSRCMVDLSLPGEPSQRLTVIGEGGSEALSCGHVIAFGRLPAPSGMFRLGFLYDASSPNAAVLQPVILYRGVKSSRWILDDALSQLIGEQPKVDTISAMRAWLARRQR